MKILVIEDNKDIIDFISLAFQVGWPGIKLEIARRGEDGLELIEKESPDAVILDLGLPDIDGFEVLKRMRLFSQIPVIILTVRKEELDIVRGLELGADEYMTKPFGQMELLARLRAILRRQNVMTEEPSIIAGPFRFSCYMHKLHYNNREIPLTTTEGMILHHLAVNSGNVISHTSLAETVWGEEYDGASDSLKVYIHRLREKIEEDPSNPKIIITKSGVGYMLMKNKV